MSSTPIVAGARVRVAIPRNEPCHLHSLESVPVLGAVGTVDRIDERLGEHSVVVVFDRWGGRFWDGPSPGWFV